MLALVRCAPYEAAGRLERDAVVVEGLGDLATLEERADGSVVCVEPRYDTSKAGGGPSRIEASIVDRGGSTRRIELPAPSALVARKGNTEAFAAHLVGDRVAVRWIERDVESGPDGIPTTTQRVRVALVERTGQEVAPPLVVAECQNCILQVNEIEAAKGLLVAYVVRPFGVSDGPPSAALVEIGAAGDLLRAHSASFLVAPRGGSGLGVVPTQADGALRVERVRRRRGPVRGRRLRARARVGAPSASAGAFSSHAPASSRRVG